MYTAVHFEAFCGTDNYDRVVLLVCLINIYILVIGRVFRYWSNKNLSPPDQF